MITVARRTLLTVAIGALAGLAFSPSAAADTKANYNNCRAAGGSVKACCAGVGGSYSTVTDAKGNVIDEICVYVNKADNAQAPPTSGPTQFQFVRPDTGLDTSTAASGGQSHVDQHGLVQEIEPVNVIP